MNKSRLFTNSFVSFFVLSALLCTPDISKAGGEKIKVTKKKRERKESKASDSTKQKIGKQRTSDADEPHPIDPTINLYNAFLGADAEERNELYEDAHNNQPNKRGYEEGEEDFFDPTIVKKEKPDTEVGIAVLLGTQFYKDSVPSSNQNIIVLDESQPMIDDVQKEANTNSPATEKPKLTESEFQALLAKANEGGAEDQIELAYMYEQGLVAGVTKEDSDKKAFELLSLAAGMGDAKAITGIALMYGKGLVKGVTKVDSEKKAFELLSLAAGKGNTNALCGLGIIYLKGRDAGVTKEDANNKAFELLSLAVNKGHVYALFSLGSLYANGQAAGVSKEDADKKAFELYSLAAEKGITDAQFSLGRMYSSGRVAGVTKENAYKKSFELFSLAAEKGDTDAQNNLGGMYANGQVTGVTKEDADKKAFELWSLAANKGLVQAQFNLGTRYLQGRVGGVSKEDSDKKAFELLTMAAEKGHAGAQYNLMAMYDHRRVVGVTEEDRIRLRLRWCEKAASNGHVKAKEFLEKQASKSGTIHMNENDSQQSAVELIQAPQTAGQAVDPRLQCVNNFKAYLENPQIQLQDDVVKVLRLKPGAEFYNRKVTKATFRKENELTVRFRKHLSSFKELPQHGNLCNFLNLQIGQFGDYLSRTTDEIQESFNIINTKPVFVDYIEVNHDYNDVLFPDPNQSLIHQNGEYSTFGKVHVVSAKRVMPQLEPIEKIMRNDERVIKAARYFISIARGIKGEESLAEVGLEVPHQLSINVAHSYVDLLSKSLDVAWKTCLVMHSNEVDLVEFEKLITFFKGSRNNLSDLGDTMHDLMERRLLLRNTLSTQHEDFKFLRPATPPPQADRVEE